MTVDDASIVSSDEIVAGFDISAEVFCSLQFEGIHNWPDCPIDEVKYLKDLHRHVFHVKAYKEVAHHDRDTEFIWLKHRIQEFIRKAYAVDESGVVQLGACSCEMIAYKLIVEFGLSRCEVNEDGENGSILTATKRILTT